MKDIKDLHITEISTIKREWSKPLLNCLDITRTENGDTADSSEGFLFFLVGGS